MTCMGITGAGRKLVAGFFAPDTKLCRMRLFRAGEDVPVKYVNMKQTVGTHGLFECAFDPEDATEYDFETDSAILADPYAHRYTGNEEYGPQTSACRGVLPGKHSREYADVPHESIDYSDMLIYKLHVRGFTMDAGSGVKNKGTFKGVKQKLSYIKGLGFNAILLMPCYEFDESMKVGYNQPPKVNFWGYGTQGFYFAPKASYASKPEQCCEEFAELVRSAHASGIEVLMEMDFAENTPDIMMLEALRFWHEVYHVDGFRLINGRTSGRLAATDPLLSGVKLIASAWPENCFGSSIKQRPVLAECNDDYMITVRRFLKGDEGIARDFSYQVKDNGNKAAKVNYLADHDGFTLADVYAYDEKHNEANGEKNADGREINYSWNCGVEGETGNRKVLRLRKKMLRNALTTLFTSQGTPMLMAGDEFGHSHKGNNNPYNCDNDYGWVVWSGGSQAAELRNYVKQLTTLRKSHRVLSNIIELRGTDYIYSGCPDVSFHGTKAWYPDYGHFSRMLGVLLNGEYARIDHVVPDNSFYLAFNMHWDSHEFDLPTAGSGEYELLLSTDSSCTYSGGKTCVLEPRSIAVFKV